jgi:threonine/homoserine/homoserine lactone efflux protein
MTFAFLLTSLIVVATPGIGVLYTVSTGLSRGSRAALIAACGCTLGILPHLSAAIVGLSAVLHTSTLAFQALKYLGVAYLLFLAWKTFREHGALAVDPQGEARGARQIIVRAVVVNLLNPKLSLFFFAFLPQFVSARDSGATQRMLVLSAVFMIMTLVVFAIYGILAAQVRRHVTSRPSVMAWIRRTFAISFLGLAAKLALAER